MNDNDPTNIIVVTYSLNGETLECSVSVNGNVVEILQYTKSENAPAGPIVGNQAVGTWIFTMQSEPPVQFSITMTNNGVITHTIEGQFSFTGTYDATTATTGTLTMTDDEDPDSSISGTYSVNGNTLTATIDEDTQYYTRLQN